MHYKRTSATGSDVRWEKYEAITSTTSIFGGHSERSQSEQARRDVATRQRRPNQRRERDGVEFAQESRSNLSSPHRQAETVQRFFT